MNINTTQVQSISHQLSAEKSSIANHVEVGSVSGSGFYLSLSNAHEWVLTPQPLSSYEVTKENQVEVTNDFIIIPPEVCENIYQYLPPALLKVFMQTLTSSKSKGKAIVRDYIESDERDNNLLQKHLQDPNFEKIGVNAHNSCDLNLYCAIKDYFNIIWNEINDDLDKGPIQSKYQRSFSSFTNALFIGKNTNQIAHDKDLLEVCVNTVLKSPTLSAITDLDDSIKKIMIADVFVLLYYQQQKHPLINAKGTPTIEFLLSQRLVSFIIRLQQTKTNFIAENNKRIINFLEENAAPEALIQILVLLGLDLNPPKNEKKSKTSSLFSIFKKDKKKSQKILQV